MTEPAIDFAYAPDSSWTLICRPDDPHKTLVREDGALLYDFEQTHLGAFAFGRTIELRAQTSRPPTRIRQRTESARVPIVVTAIQYPDCHLELRAVGHRDPQGRRYDIVLWSLRVDDDAESSLTGLHVDISERGALRHTGSSAAPDQRVFAVDVDSVPSYPLFGDESSQPPGDPGVSPIMVSTPQRLAVTHPSGFRPASGLHTVPSVVAGGETMHGALVLPLDDAPPPDVSLDWARRALASERAHWESLRGLDLPIEVPRQDLQDMLVAAARNILQARDLDADGNPVFQVGPTVYRGLWVVDGYFLLEAARYLGLDDDAARGVRALLDKARPDGSIDALGEIADPQEHPHLKETAIGIATLVRQWQLAKDDAWLREVWPVIRRGVAHIATLRERAAALPRESAAFGLLPPAFADGGAAGVRPELTTALWTVAGLRFAATAAKRLFPAEAADITALADTLQAAVEAHVTHSAQRLPDGHRYLPMVLPGSGKHHTRVGVDTPPPQHALRPQTATWALAQAIWPGEVFAPDDAVVADFLHLLDTVEQEGVPVESGWLPYRALWTYYASFAAHVCLYADRPGQAVRLLYGMCRHAAPTRVWREEQPLRSTGHDQLWGDMPHNWASAELIRLVRHLMVFEQGDQLRLLDGVPASWPGEGRLRVRDTPTRFGTVSLHVEASLIRMSIDTSRATASGEGVLRVPEGEWRIERDGHTRHARGPRLLRFRLDAEYPPGT